jgi:hypothetical protein
VKVITRAYIRKLIKEALSEAAADKYVHVGYGNYKEKGKEKDSKAQVFKKTDSGKFVPAGGDDSKGAEKAPDKPKVTDIDANPFDTKKTDDDPDSEFGKDYTSKFMGTSEPEDKPFGGDTGKDADTRDEAEVQDAIEGAEEGINDAIARGMDYGDPDVADMVRDDMEYAKNRGATIKDFENLANKMQSAEASEIINDALIDVYGESGSLADPNMDKPGYDSPGARDTKGSDNPYDWKEPDEDEGLQRASEANLDKHIDDALDRIPPDQVEDTFEKIINRIDDEDHLEMIMYSLENDNIPTAANDPIGAISHAVVLQGIEDGTLDYNSKGMEISNFLANVEEDLYTRMTESEDLVDNIQKEFVEYDRYNKHILKSFI